MSVNDVCLPTNCYGRGKLSQDRCPHQILSYDCISSRKPQFLYLSDNYIGQYLLSSGTRGLMFGLRLHLHLYFMYASNVLPICADSYVHWLPDNAISTWPGSTCSINI